MDAAFRLGKITKTSAPVQTVARTDRSTCLPVSKPRTVNVFIRFRPKCYIRVRVSTRNSNVAKLMIEEIKDI